VAPCADLFHSSKADEDTLPLLKIRSRKVGRPDSSRQQISPSSTTLSTRRCSAIHVASSAKPRNTFPFLEISSPWPSVVCASARKPSIFSSCVAFAVIPVYGEAGAAGHITWTWKFWSVNAAAALNRSRVIGGLRPNALDSVLRTAYHHTPLFRTCGAGCFVMKYILFLCVFVLTTLPVLADGHGPAFGFSTATLGTGDSSVETGLMWRAGVAMISPRVSYGIKPNFQLSVSSPVHLNHGEHPVGRFSGLIPGDPAIEVLGAWRFHHALTGVGTRNESTLYLGMSGTTQTLPLAGSRPLSREPGYYVGAATGHISRRYYAWAGAGYEHHGRWSTGDADHQSDTLFASVAVGWRPAYFDKDYPKPDLRFFWETTGEQVGRARIDTTAPITGPIDTHNHGDPTPLPPPNSAGIIVLPNSGRTAVYSGPSFLWTHRGVAFQTGVLYKAWSHVDGSQPAERFRVMFGVSYFFQGGSK
jgi:hypothetical protein